MTWEISDEERQALIAKAHADLAASRAEDARRVAAGEPPPRVSSMKGHIASGPTMSCRPLPDGSTESYQPSFEELMFTPLLPGDCDGYGNKTEQFYARNRTIARLAAELSSDRTSTQRSENSVILRRAGEGAVVEYPDGSRLWRDRRWRLHRTNGPASEDSDGRRAWFVDGLPHRTDGPAFELSDGIREWWVDGRRHRTDGPAVERGDGTREWWVDGRRHRDDGPAVERPGESREWYHSGVRHREGGPAVEYPDGYRVVYVNGRRHRVDGPAVEGTTDKSSWWLNGVNVSEDEVRRAAQVRRGRGRRTGWRKHE